MSEQLAQIIGRCGFDQWGICSFADVLPLLEVRAKSRLPASSQSLIVLLSGYYTGDYPDRNISRYAVVDDYHTVLHEKLEKLSEELQIQYKQNKFIPFVDSSPVAEVRAAYLAGLGGIGLNGQLLNPVYGSYCFIAELVTDLQLPPFSPYAQGICTGCGRCVAACPTGALSHGRFEKDKCRSHITQKKGALSEWEREEIRAGGFVWGCDRCTDACPVNSRVQQAEDEAFYRDIQPVVGYDNAGRLCKSKAYGWRGEAVLLRNLDIILRKDMV